MKKTNFKAPAAALGMLVLILDGQTAIRGMQDGIELSLKTLVPSLFPFFVLSILLTGALIGQPVKFLRPLGRLCRIPAGAESLLAIGLVGGYPVGAQNISTAYHNGSLSGSDASRMAAFCNNAGPAFIFGMLSPLFSDHVTLWALWLIHMISALLVGVIIPCDGDQQPVRQAARPASLTTSLEKAISVIALVCGWVVLFRMVLAFLDRWFLWRLPQAGQAAVAGLLELSNGCVMLGETDNEGLRFILAAGMLAFGGICVTMQTASVSSGLSHKLYFPGKLLQTCFSFLLAVCCQHFLPFSQKCSVSVCIISVCIVIAAVLTVYLRHPQKRSSIPALLGV